MRMRGAQLIILAVGVVQALPRFESLMFTDHASQLARAIDEVTGHIEVAGVRVSTLSLDPRWTSGPLSSPNGHVTGYSAWRYPELQAHFDSVRVDVYWTETRQRRWTSASGTCGFVFDEFKYADALASPVLSGTSSSGGAACIVTSSTGKTYIYSVRASIPRCGRQGMVVVRVPWAPPALTLDPDGAEVVEAAPEPLRRLLLPLAETEASKERRKQYLSFAMNASGLVQVTVTASCRAALRRWLAVPLVMVCALCVAAGSLSVLALRRAAERLS